MRALRIGAVAALATWVVLGAACPASAAPRGEARSEDWLIWQQRLEESELELTRARERLVAARAAHRRALPGAAPAESLLEGTAGELARAESLLADAEHRQRVLLDRARRAGVPETWLAPVSSPLPAQQAD